MHNRRNRYGVVYRGMFSPDKLRVKNLDGKIVPEVHWCKSCKSYLPMSMFYFESASRKKQKEQARNMCIPCWDIKKGKVSPKSEKDGATLDVFLE